jgi:hypothetical protein
MRASFFDANNTPDEVGVKMLPYSGGGATNTLPAAGFARK